MASSWRLLREPSKPALLGAHFFWRDDSPPATAAPGRPLAASVLLRFHFTECNVYWNRATSIPAPSETMTVSITGTRSELGAILVRQRAIDATRSVHVNVAGQQANSLLHDGHAWKHFGRTSVLGIRRALRSARSGGATVLVHASFAFVRAVELGAAVDEPLRSLVDAILECEALALSGPVPACVVRLGYLYGPESRDLRAYRRAFQLGRPYWSGPVRVLQYHLHQSDAAFALLAAARRRNAGKVFYATDGIPASFTQLMDAFARRVGRRNPLHLPLFSKPVARLIVREEHMQQVALPMPPRAPAPRVPGWKPRFADFRKGLDDVVEAWEAGQMHGPVRGASRRVNENPRAA